MHKVEKIGVGWDKKEIRRKIPHDSQRSRLEIIRQDLQHGGSDKHAKPWILIQHIIKIISFLYNLFIGAMNS